MSLTFQTIRSLFSVKPVTSEVARSHVLLYLKSDTESNAAKCNAKAATNVGNLASKLEILAHCKKESAEAVAKHLESAEKWLNEVQKTKPDAIVYARKTKHGSGKQESSAITLYTKSRPNNFISKWIDSHFYSADKALAAETLAALASHYAPAANAAQGKMPHTDLKQQAKAASDGVSIQDFSKKISEYGQAALGPSIIESALFDPLSTLGSYLYLAITPNKSPQQSNPSDKVAGLSKDAENELIGTHSLSPKGIAAFKEFIKGIKTGVTDANLQRKCILEFCENWEASYYGEQNFKAFINSNPTLKEWSAIALIVAGRNRYFYASREQGNSKYKLGITDDLAAFIGKIDVEMKSTVTENPLDFAKETVDELVPNGKTGAEAAQQVTREVVEFMDYKLHAFKIEVEGKTNEIGLSVRDCRSAIQESLGKAAANIKGQTDEIADTSRSESDLVSNNVETIRINFSASMDKLKNFVEETATRTSIATIELVEIVTSSLKENALNPALETADEISENLQAVAKMPSAWLPNW